MENTTKALYMVIGVFLGILILTLLVYVFNKGTDFLATTSEQEQTKQIEQYNADLIIYNKDNNTIFDVVTACNLAYDINKKNEYDNENCLKIKLKVLGTTYELENNSTQPQGEIGGEKLTKLIQDYGQDKDETDDIYEYKHTFTGKVKNSEKTGKINEITFELN